jgi:hypothetical protein
VSRSCGPDLSSRRVSLSGREQIVITRSGLGPYQWFRVRAFVLFLLHIQFDARYGESTYCNTGQNWPQAAVPVDAQNKKVKADSQMENKRNFVGSSQDRAPCMQAPRSNNAPYFFGQPGVTPALVRRPENGTPSSSTTSTRRIVIPVSYIVLRTVVR